MAGGYSNKEIGGALGVSEGTVKNHVSSVLSIGMRDRTRAVLRALELGWGTSEVVIRCECDCHSDPSGRDVPDVLGTGEGQTTS